MLHAASWGEKTADEHGSMVTNLLFPPKVVRHKVNPLSYAPKKESAVFVAPVRVPPPQPSPVIHVGSDGDVLFATVAPMPQRDPDPRPERGSIACLLDGGIQVITSAVGSRGHPDGDNVVERIFSLLRGGDGVKHSKGDKMFGKLTEKAKKRVRGAFYGPLTNETDVGDDRSTISIRPSHIPYASRIVRYRLRRRVVMQAYNNPSNADVANAIYRQFGHAHAVGSAPHVEAIRGLTAQVAAARNNHGHFVIVLNRVVGDTLETTEIAYGNITINTPEQLGAPAAQMVHGRLQVTNVPLNQLNAAAELDFDHPDIRNRSQLISLITLVLLSNPDITIDEIRDVLNAVAQGRAPPGYDEMVLTIWNFVTGEHGGAAGSSQAREDKDEDGSGGAAGAPPTKRRRSGTE